MTPEEQAKKFLDDHWGEFDGAHTNAQFEVMAGLIAGLIRGWRPIDADAKTGNEVLLGFAGGRDMDFYRWNQALADDPSPSSMPPEQAGWADRCSDPPHEIPTHYMIIEGPEIA